MIDELKTPEGALPRLVQDTMVHLVRQSGPLSLVRVALPAAWDGAAFAAGMAARYAERGHAGVRVVVLPTEGEPRLLSVLIG